MSVEVPPIGAWLRRAAEAPAVLEAAPEGFPGGVVRVSAVVSDLWERLTGSPAPPSLLGAFAVTQPGETERMRLRGVLFACHVLTHPVFVGRPVAPIERLLVQELSGWAAAVGAQALGSEERREELVRRCLRAARLRPGGESETEAEDRLRQVDAVERARVLRDAEAREKRAREVREAMARAAAQEAAAKVSRE